MTETSETWLTQEAFDALSQELDERSGPIAADITAKIQAARDEGDLKENGGYHAAREEQGKNEARIRVLKHLLENAQIGTPPGAEDGVATHGSVVTIDFGDGDTEVFRIGSREETAVSDIEVYSPTSPLGAAVMGAKQGDEVSYELPNGRSASVTVVDVKSA